MLRTAPLLLVALIGCEPAADRGAPRLFLDPGRVDLAIDGPGDPFPAADLVLANVGDAPTTLFQVALLGEHASLVQLDADIGAELAPGDITTIRASLVGSVSPSEAPFREELELVAVGTVTEYDDPAATAIVGVGMLEACDVDADGSLAFSCGGDDCDDTDADVRPGGAEICDGLDQDCDGVSDEQAEDAPTWYPDDDRDGHGDLEAQVASCTPPSGYLDHAGDCDDDDASVHPGAKERCDGVDEDCDGVVDDDAIDPTRFYRDADGDGHGSGGDTTLSCTQPAGYVATPDDCDDTDGTAFPGGVEVCDGDDDDCDGAVDDGAVDAFVVYVDDDRDGHGNKALPARACGLSVGYAAVGDDCNDGAAGVYPGAPEVCNVLDDDCDGVVDEGALGSYYKDFDGDGLGDPNSPSVGCKAQNGYVQNAKDCDDKNAAIKDGSTYYGDSDADGFGNGGVSRKACTQPAGFVVDNTDCNDAAPSVHPGAPEACDGVDQDCDGLVDDNATGGNVWYADFDKDNYGDPTDTLIQCPQPAGYSLAAGDCDDLNKSIHPGANETCNGRDDDCNGRGDDGNVCPCPTFDYRTSVYMICDLQVPAVAALAACTSFGYDATDIDSIEEDLFLDGAIDQVRRGRSFWISLNDLDSEGQHEWYTGLPVTYTDWAPSQPNDPSGFEDCVVIDSSRHWADTTCFTNAAFICESLR